MKVIIAGGRDYLFTKDDIASLNTLWVTIPITEVVSGAARGADRCGEEWATSHNIPIKQFPANWDKFGKSAGYRRNEQMALYADAVILFPGGKGTSMMFNIANEHGLQVFDLRKGNNDY